MKQERGLQVLAKEGSDRWRVIEQKQGDEEDCRHEGFGHGYLAGWVERLVGGVAGGG